MKRALKRSTLKDFNIWWAPPNRFDALTSTTVSLLCIAAVITGFFGALIGQTATFAAEEFGASDRAQGVLLATIRIGFCYYVLRFGILHFYCAFVLFEWAFH